MRASVLVLVFLAGCTAEAVDPLADVDPTAPLFGSSGLDLVGPHVEENPDTLVLIGDCRAGRTLAYTFNTTLIGFTEPVAVLEAPLGVPNATRFILAAFTPQQAGMELAWVQKGGTATLQLNPFSTFNQQYFGELPPRLAVPLTDGIGRLVIACQGDGPVAYLITDDVRVDRPHYITPVDLGGFDVFGATGYASLGTIYIPPAVPPSFPTIWAVAGGATIRTEDRAPSDAVRMGITEITWSGRPGWTSAACSFTSFGTLGAWSYEGLLHNAPRERGGLLVDALISQQFVSGALRTVHTEEGTEPGSLTFRIEHEIGENSLWTMRCEGIHFDGTLQEAFGAPAVPTLDFPEGFV